MGLCIISTTIIRPAQSIILGLTNIPALGVFLFKTTQPSALNGCVDVPPTQCDRLTQYIYLSDNMTAYVDINTTPNVRYYYRLASNDLTKWVSELVTGVRLPSNPSPLTNIVAANCMNTTTFTLVIDVLPVRVATDQLRYFIVRLLPAIPPATVSASTAYANFSAFVTVDENNEVTATYSTPYNTQITTPATGTIDGVANQLEIVLLNLPLTLVSPVVSVVRVDVNGNAIGNPIYSMVTATGTCI